MENVGKVVKVSIGIGSGWEIVPGDRHPIIIKAGCAHNCLLLSLQLVPS